VKWQSEDAQLKRDLATIEARTEGAEAERNRIIELVERERIKPDAAMFAAVQFDGWKDGQSQPRTAEEIARAHEQHEQAREGIEEAARAAMSAGQYPTGGK
jgi:hypothetical protein